VQAVRAVVDRQLVGFAVQAEGAAGDPVAEPADQGPEVGIALDVALQVVEAERHVVELAVAVGHPDRLYDPAVGQDGHFHPVGVGQGVDIDLGAVGQRAERVLTHTQRARLGARYEGHGETARQREAAEAEVISDKHCVYLPFARLSWRFIDG
jgi:hypothetical protein